MQPENKLLKIPDIVKLWISHGMEYLERPLVVHTVHDDEPVGDAVPVAGNLPGASRANAAVRRGWGGGGEGGGVRLESLGVYEPDAFSRAPLRVDVGHVDVLDGRVKRLQL